MAKFRFGNECSVLDQALNSPNAELIAVYDQRRVGRTFFGSRALSFQRADYCTHLCEMKFSFEPNVIKKAYSRELQQKEAVYRARTGTRHTLFLTMITASGLAKNSYSQTLVPCQVELQDLML